MVEPKENIEDCIKKYYRSYFQFHSVALEISTDQIEILAFFKAEYSHFLLSKPQINQKNNRVRLHFQKSDNEVKNPKGWIKTQVCEILFFRQKRRYVYQDGSFADDFSIDSRRILKFFYRELTTGVEEGNLFLLSSVGELIEYSGWLRLHACGFEDGKSSYVFPGDSGFGKSTLSKSILFKTDLKILSDEMVLTDGTRYISFPMRISLKDEFASQSYAVEKWYRNRNGPKWQLSVPSERISTRRLPGKIFLSTELNRFSYFIRVLSGYGLPQMKEYFIRQDNLAKLIKVFFRRIAIFIKLYPQMEKMEVGQRQSQKMLNLLVKTTEF